MLDLKVIKDNNLLFDTNLSVGEDTTFINTYFLYEKSIGVLDECFYYLRIREGSANVLNDGNPVLMTENKLKIIDARLQIDKLAKDKHNFDTTQLWNGTIVFSAVQLAFLLSKNKKNTFYNNYLTYKRYMENDVVKKVVSNFKPGCGVKAIPFYLIKGYTYKLFLVICYIVPDKLIKKIL